MAALSYLEKFGEFKIRAMSFCNAKTFTALVGIDSQSNTSADLH